MSLKRTVSPFRSTGLGMSASTRPPDMWLVPRLTWRSEFAPAGDAHAIDLGARNPWRDHIPHLTTYLHRNRSHVSVRRFAIGGEAVIRRLSGDRRIRYRFVDENRMQAAVGFEIDVDALTALLTLKILVACEDLSLIGAKPRAFSIAERNRAVSSHAKMAEIRDAVTRCRRLLHLRARGFAPLTFCQTKLLTSLRHPSKRFVPLSKP